MVMMNQNPYLSSFSPALQALEFQAQQQMMQGAGAFQGGAMQMQQLQMQQQMQQMMMMQAMLQAAQARDMFGGMGMPGQMPGIQPMVGPGAVSPTAQAGGVQSPDQVMAGGGVTTGLQDVSNTGTPPWPKGTVQTPGGYFVVPSAQGQGQGAQGFAVYGPKADGTKPTGKDDGFKLTNIWGDPHVDDGKGNTMFSFTKNSDMRLPDGTVIAMNTTAQKGVSLVQGFDVQNGSSHVGYNWNAANNNYDTTGDKQDGFNYMAQHLSSTNWSHDTFNLAIDKQGNPKFFEFVNGQDIGLITGDTRDGDQSYLPKVDSSQTNYATVMGDQYKPQPGTTAYGNSLFQQSLDLFADPKYQNNLPTGVIDQISQRWKNDIIQTQQGLTGANAISANPSVSNMQQAGTYPGMPQNQFFGGMNPSQMAFMMMMRQAQMSQPQINSYNYFGR